MIRLIHWNHDEGLARKRFLQEQGYSILFDEFTPELLKSMKSDPPDAIIIDLSRLPSQGRDLGVNLRVNKSTRNVPLLFVGGSTAKVEKIELILPDAIFSSWNTVKADLRNLSEKIPAEPVVPDSLFAGYSGKSLHEKLGILKNSTVTVINSPKDFAESLKGLPEGVNMCTDSARKSDVTLWFNRSLDELESRLEQTKPLASSGKFWILWPKKSSGIQSDLTQAVVRKTGLSAGLVDYKICSVNSTWSGLCFTLKTA